jgi:3-deoxy-D-manno-octulosonate 8-phosphate phosphatase (KDO 8-P phosphatase)
MSHSAFRIPHSAFAGVGPRPGRLTGDVLRRARRVQLLVLDVDGVLTDGRIVYTAAGDECMAFHILDGHGIKLALRAGLRVAIITGRESPMVARRAQDLGVTELFQRVEAKRAVFDALLARHALRAEETACMGDDLLDLPLLSEAGLALTVPSAAAEVRAAAHYVTRRPAGAGAVREAVELLLKARGLWEDVVRSHDP